MSDKHSENIKLSLFEPAASHEIAHALHATLDIEQILQAFSEHLNSVIGIDSFSFQNRLSKTHYHQGKIGLNQFNFKLSADDEELGEITITRQGRFASDEIAVLEEQLCFLINPLKNAINHLDALHAALHDPLTGLFNRGSLENTLQREIKLAERHHKPLSMLLADIDNFKKINDSHGHLAGDNVLKAIARLIENTIRETDIAFRIGGEEFLVLLNDTDDRGAKKLAERLRKQIEHANYSEQQAPVAPFTVSIGLACYQEPESHQSLIDRADKAMYRAKLAGKNRVYLAN